MGEFVIEVEDPRVPDIAALLETHLEYAARNSPPEDVHALDISGLLAEEVTFFSLRESGRLLGVGALRQLGADNAEIKSMHTAEAARGRGVGRAILDHLVEVAQQRGCERVSLETGTMEEFSAARSLYESAGFEPCEPFGGMRASPYSVCMTVRLPIETTRGSSSHRRPAARE